MKHFKNSDGFSAIELILVVVVVDLVGFLGYYAYSHRKVVPPAQDTPATSSPKKTTPAPVSTLPAGWEYYENQSLGFKFGHPKDWAVDTKDSKGCPPVASDYGASMCPLDGSLTPKQYLDYQTKKYGNLVSPLVGFGVYSKSTKSLATLYDEFKSTYASQDGYTSTPSNQFFNNGLTGFYVNQKTNSYSDNIYVIQVANGTYLSIRNRESNKHYTPGGGSVDDQNDYTSYSATLNAIVKTVAPIK